MLCVPCALLSLLLTSVWCVPISRPSPGEDHQDAAVQNSVMVDMLKDKPLTPLTPPALEEGHPPHPPSFLPPQSNGTYRQPSLPNKSSLPGIPNKMEGPAPPPLLFPLSSPPIPLPAEECLTKDGEVGECLSAHDCGQTNGMMSGLCHQGMDHSAYPRVCCTYQAHCGFSTSKMVSYFTSPAYPQIISNHSDWNLEVDLKPGVCQVRLWTSFTSIWLACSYC